MKKRQNTEICIIKADTTHTGVSRQDIGATGLGMIEPPDNPALLVEVVDNSFVVGGVCEKISTTAASEWTFSDEVSEETKKIFSSVDLEELFLSFFVTGNAYFEKIRNGFGQVVALERFLPQHIRIRWNKDTKEREYIYKSGTASQQVIAAEDIVHIKTASLKSKHYGSAKMGKCVSQVALLAEIDKYYAKVFDNWFFNNKIMVDKNGEMTPEQKDALRAYLTDRAQGLANAFSLTILPFDASLLNLDDIANVEKFLTYREDLIQSIAIALNVPVDILLPQKASRATKEVSLSELNTDIIWPMQRRVLEAFKKSLRKEIPDIDWVGILAIDTKNQLDEMKVLTGYQSAGAMTANEVRAKIGLDAIDGGDELTTRENTTEASEVEKVEQSIQKIYDSIYSV